MDDEVDDRDTDVEDAERIRKWASMSYRYIDDLEAMAGCNACYLMQRSEHQQAAMKRAVEAGQQGMVIQGLAQAARESIALALGTEHTCHTTTWHHYLRVG